LSLVFESSSGGNLLSSSSATVDFTLPSLSIQAPTGEKIYEAQVGVTGSNSTSPTLVSLGEVVTDNGTAEPNLSGNLSTSPTLTSQTFASNQSVSSNADFAADYGGSTTTLTTATMTYTAAPEPVSSSLLVVGLTGVGFVRRKIRRG
jgi:hypothetical protein